MPDLIRAEQDIVLERYGVKGDAEKERSAQNWEQIVADGPEQPEKGDKTDVGGLAPRNPATKLTWPPPILSAYLTPTPHTSHLPHTYLTPTSHTSHLRCQVNCRRFGAAAAPAACLKNPSQLYFHKATCRTVCSH